ncbi:MAG: HAMP domain-containing sensor histidine kinase [Pseudomonadales bacterium]
MLKKNREEGKMLSSIGGGADSKVEQEPKYGRFQHFLADLEDGCLRSWQYSKEKSVFYGVLGVTLVPTAFLIERAVTVPSFDTAIFRIFPTVLTIPLLLFPKLPSSIRAWFHFYWIFTLTMVFPFTYSAVLILNAAMGSSAIHPLWFYEMLFSMFALVQFTSHSRLAVLLFLLGVAFGASTLLFVDKPNWDLLYETAIVPAPILAITFLVLLVSNRHIFKAREEKLLALRFVAGNIAEELRNPLSTIKYTVSGTENLMPELVHGYRFAIEAGYVGKGLRDSQLETLEDALTSVKREVERSAAIIDILLLNSLERPIISLKVGSTTAKAIVGDLVDSYPYNNSFEKKSVEVEVEGDFDISGPLILVRHTVLNLMKNAILHSHKAKVPRVRISINGLAREIRVMNNGSFVRRENFRRIYEYFYTSGLSGEGIGNGLSFCKMVMETIDGGISLRSSPKYGTEFTLRFPETCPKLTPRLVEAPNLNW